MLRVRPANGGSLRGYLARALRNVLAMRARSKSRARAREAATERTFAASASEVAERAELHRFLVASVLALPEPQRGIVLLHHFDGVAVADLARRTGLTPDAVRAHLRRGRDALRGKVQQSGHGASRAFAALVGTSSGVSAAVVVAMTVQTKVVLAATVVVAVWLGWVMSNWGSPPVALQIADVESSGAAPIGSAAFAPPVVENEPPGDRARVDVGVATPVARFRLVGMREGVPWTAAVRVRARGLSGPEDVHQEFTTQRTPREDGTFDVALPAWVTTCSAFSLELRADDPRYLQLSCGEYSPTFVANKFVGGVVELRVRPAAVVTGRVVDVRGAPVATAQIRAYHWNGTQPASPCGFVNTAADGSFVLQAEIGAELWLAVLPMREQRVILGNDGWPEATEPEREDLLVAFRRVRSTFYAPSDVGVITLPDTSFLEGTLVDGAGRAVSGVSVRAVAAEAVRAERWYGHRQLVETVDGHAMYLRASVTDADGRFRIGMPTGARVRLELEGEAPSHRLAVASQTFAAPANVRVQLHGHVVVVRVLRRGEPVFEATVERSDGAPPAKTDPAGDIRILSRHAGVTPLRLTVRAPGTLARVVDVPDGASVERPFLVDVGDEGTATLEIEVLGTDAPHVAGVRLQSIDDRSCRIEAPWIVRVAGEPFRCHVPHGRYRGEIGAGAYAGAPEKFMLTQSFEVEVPTTGIRTKVPVRFGGRLTFEIEDENAAPVACVVTLIDATGARIVPSLGGSHGPYEGGVLPGDSRLVASRETYAPGASVVLIDFGRGRDLVRVPVEVRVGEYVTVRHVVR